VLRALLIAVPAAIIGSLSDIRRYIRIRRM
jgi:hypothetical protein